MSDTIVRTYNHEAPGVQVLDQRVLPFQIRYVPLNSVEEAAVAIRDMIVRGAPLIGVTAAYGMWLAAREAPEEEELFDVLRRAADRLRATRPTAVNLAWGLERQLRAAAEGGSRTEIAERLLQRADLIAAEDAEMCRNIGLHGLEIIREIAARKRGERVNILTHCNAGRLACVEYGTATAPIYLAHKEGIDLHVWVDETRPRLQGAKLTAFELGERGVPHTVIPDNVAGHLMQRGMVDTAIVGCDRLTRRGDACNKIGTYTKAVVAARNGIPFYVALPSSTIDWGIADWNDIPIEERTGDEVRFVQGREEGREELKEVEILPSSSAVVNFGFDVTPAELVTGIITERGVCTADEEDLARLFPEQAGAIVD